MVRAVIVVEHNARFGAKGIGSKGGKGIGQSGGDELPSIDFRYVVALPNRINIPTQVDTQETFPEIDALDGDDHAARRLMGNRVVHVIEQIG